MSVIKNIVCGGLLSGLLLSFFLPSVSASGVWITDDFGDYNDYRLINAFVSESSDHNSYSRVSASIPK